MDKKNNRAYKILIVDDEPLIRQSLFEILKIEKFSVQMASSGEEALEMIEKNPVDIVVTDLKLPKMDGLKLLENVKKQYPDIDLIVITGYGSIESAVDAMKKGAYDYITKPINDSEIKIIINKIIEKKTIIAENVALKEGLLQQKWDAFSGMIGSSDKMQKVYHTIEAVASTNATILVTGESGTGKGLVARAIHENDQNRKDKPFIEISCGALTETLLESELFGHVKGAFTGAIKDKEGRFEYAGGGTIFLDEIDTFTLPLQVKLLRVLQDGVFERVGDNETRKANARIIVATNKVLSDLVESGEFREDLYYRINVIMIQTPPLRDRKEDIPYLLDFFLQKYNSANNKEVTGVSDEVKRIFEGYHWPGNIREFENAIEGAIILAKTDFVNKWDLPNLTKFSNVDIVRPSEDKNLKKIVEQPEREHIISVLKDHHWNRNKAAAALGVNRTTLYNKMKKYDISKENS